MVEVSGSTSRRCLLPGNVACSSTRGIASFRMPTTGCAPFGRLCGRGGGLATGSARPIGLPSFCLSRKGCRGTGSACSSGAGNGGCGASCGATVALSAGSGDNRILNSETKGASFKRFALRDFFPGLSTLPHGARIIIHVAVGSTGSVS